LKGDAALFRQRQRVGGIETEDVECGKARDRRHLVAVFVELAESLDTARLEIRFHAVNHFVKVVARDLEPAHRIAERGPDRTHTGAPFKRGFHLFAPLFEGFPVGARLIAQVVAVAHERIESAHRVALLAGEQDKRVVEIARAASRNVAAVPV
jgi:hypothetical protein